MAESTGSISADFGLNLTPLQRGFVEAEAIARSGAARVARAAATPSIGGGGRSGFATPGGFGSGRVFGAQPRNVAAAASAGGLLPPARPGQYPAPAGAANQFALPRGAGRVLSLFAGIGELAGFFERANEEAGKLREKIAAIVGLTGSSAFRGVGEMEEKLKGASSTLDEIYKRDHIEAQGGTGGLGAMLRIGRHIATGGTGADDEAQKTELRKAASRATTDMAEKQAALNAAEGRALFISERQAKLDKEEIEHREKLGRIAAESARTGADDESRRGLVNGENERYRLAKVAINRPADLADQLLRIRRNVSRGGVTPNRAKLAELYAKRAAANDRDRLDVDADIYDERFRQNQIHNGEGGYNFEAANAERRATRERNAFDARDNDRTDRASRGAYKDSSNQSQTATESGLPEKIDALISTLNELPAKIGVI